MHDLTITPRGHLLVREQNGDARDRPLSKGLVGAYAADPAGGMLYSATEEADVALPAAFAKHSPWP